MKNPKKQENNRTENRLRFAQNWGNQRTFDARMGIIKDRNGKDHERQKD